MNLVEGSSVKVVDLARVPEGIAYPLLVLFNSYIEDEDDIAKLFDAPVVGKIPNFTLYDDNGERKKGFFSKKGGASK